MHDDLGVLFHHARLQAVDPKSRHPELVAMLKERGFVDESVADERQLFFWRAEISNTSLDSHFTRMSESTLRNYADDALAGVAFLKGHDHRSLPIGYSFNAALEGESGKQRVVADFYTVAGLPDSDDLIARVQTGLLRDVSVGFHGGEMRCTLCEKDFWSCPHFPGVRYEDGLATFTIEDARLSEVSGVFDGSTPGAMILKATREAEAGRIKSETVRLLENTYRVTLPVTKRAFAGVELEDGQTPRKVQRMNEQQFARLTDILVSAKVVPADQRETLDEDGALQAADKLAKRVSDLEPQAADGRQYRNDLVSEALAEGVRAQGQGFDEETYKAMLTNAPLATIKRMRGDWQKIGDERLQGGRQSFDGDQTPQPAARVVSHIPATAYQG